jgi:RNA polymerase sigma-70 factor (ECF subfamily)
VASLRTWPTYEGDSTGLADSASVNGEHPRSSEPDPPGSPLFGGGERELVTAVLQKNRKAAAQLVAAHVDAIYGYVRHRLLPRSELADDVVQDVFLAALDGLAAFQGTSSLRAWLIGIARHKVDDLYRQLLRTPRPLEDETSAGDEPASVEPPIDERLDSARLRERAQAILKRLPERYGLLLLWRYWEQKTAREMAEATGTTEKSVERTLARARAHFRALWLEDSR